MGCEVLARQGEALRVVRWKTGVADQVLSAPFNHLRNDGQHAVAHRSQGVFHFWRNDLVVGAFDETKGGQGL